MSAVKAPFRAPLLAMTAAALLTAPWATVMGGAESRTMTVSAVVRPSFSIASMPLVPGQAEAFVASRSDAGDASAAPDATAFSTRPDGFSGASLISLNLKRLRPEVVVEFAADVAAFAAAEVSAETNWMVDDRIAMQWGPEQMKTVLDQVAVTVLRYRLKNGNGSQPANLALPVLVTVSL
jgi:hypothetical protein